MKMEYWNPNVLTHVSNRTEHHAGKVQEPHRTDFDMETVHCTGTCLGALLETQISHPKFTSGFICLVTFVLLKLCIVCR